MFLLVRKLPLIDTFIFFQGAPKCNFCKSSQFQQFCSTSVTPNGACSIFLLLSMKKNWAQVKRVCAYGTHKKKIECKRPSERQQNRTEYWHTVRAASEEERAVCRRRRQMSKRRRGRALAVIASQDGHLFLSLATRRTIR